MLTMLIFLGETQVGSVAVPYLECVPKIHALLVTVWGIEYRFVTIDSNRTIVDEA